MSKNFTDDPLVARLPARLATVAEVNFDPFAGPELLRLVPITESQAEIWAACLLGGDDASRAYNESVTLRLTGPLDRPALQRALQALVQRHEALRSAFSADGKYSCVFRELPPTFDYHNTTTLGEAEQRAAVAACVAHDAQYVFDLLYGPLLKASLVELATEEHHLVLTAHHIVCDGWSLGILLQELGALYSAYYQGLPPVLPAATPFGQYADQQLLFSRSAAYEAVEQYWLAQYLGRVPALALPTDLPRPALRTYRSARADYPLAPGLVAGLKKVGLGAGCSLVTTLLAAFEVLLAQLTGQSEIVVGLPAAGQSASGLPQLVGHCVNLLPLRSQPYADGDFKAYLRQRKTALFDAYEHQQLTFGSLLKKLRLTRDAARVPLVPVVFNIDLGLTNDVGFQGLHYELINNPRAYESFELFLNASGTEQNLVLEWSYNTDLFKAETIGSWMVAFEALLSSIIAEPTASLRALVRGEVAPLAAAYYALNATARPYPAHKTLHQLIAEQARAAPERLALRFKEQELTYSELDRRANQFANYLGHQGVRLGDVVGIAVERSPALVVALLALMKCGAAYVPLDPAYPAERLEFMLTDAGAKLLLASAPAALATAAPVLAMEEAFKQARTYSDQEPAALPDSQQVLYVLYTSGSTGKPKGVEITHRNAINFLCSMQQAPGITAEDRLLAITTISFDIAGLELYLPLVSGATVVLADAYAAKDGQELLRLITAEKITIMQATPSSWRLMLDAGWQQPLPLKVLSGGEALPLELAGRLLARSEAVWNLYGPTETTIWSSVKQLCPTDTEVSIGQPIANTQFYILDEHGRPAAPGTPGELCIAGDGVGRGYLNRPALTAEKFEANPFANAPGALLYHTGDLGRLLPTGEVQCLGRLDQQMKIRGYRIEPAEIEHALEALGEVRQAVVSTYERQPGDERLVAYVVLAGLAPAPLDRARTTYWQQALLGQLPAYMVPTDFVVLSALPLTLNGKLDRKALPAPIGPEATKAPVPRRPRTDLENLVAATWQDCLGVAQVELSDDFFQLGGHSLIAVQVMARLAQQTGQRLPLATLFEHPTVEKLAAVLQQGSPTTAWGSLVPIKPEGTKTPLYIVHGAGFNVLIFNALSKQVAADQPVYGLQAKGLDGIEEPSESVEEMAAHYVAAITAANPNGPYALAGYSFGGIVAFEMARQLRAAGKQIKFLGMFDTYAERSDHEDPWLRKILKRSLFRMKRLMYNLVVFKNNPRGAVRLKMQSLRRATVERLAYSPAEQYERINGHPHRLGLVHALAHRKFRLQPQDIAVHVFRSKERLYYLEDFTYLGWSEFALAGVKTYDMPGNHFQLFAPPHDAECAQLLQAALDQCD
jgi:amino acid adenylation domain-containing protein